MVSTTALERVETLPGPAGRHRSTLDPAAIAIVTMVVAVLGIDRPSLWYDEAATLSAASRPLSELWAMVHNIDAVHGLYYLVMHCWLAILPSAVHPNELFLRLPSTFAVGLAAAGVVVLGKQLSTRTVALTAGLIFAVLPRVTWAGIEARSYALTMAAAVWLTVMCVVAVRRRAPAIWLMYAVAIVLATVLNVYVLLIVAAHAVVVAFAAERRPRAVVPWVVVPWVVAVGVATLTVTPFLLFSRSQIAQVRWISPLGWHNVSDVLREQYFDDSVPFAVLAAIVMTAAALLHRPSRLLPENTGRRLVCVAAVWIVVPTAALLVHSALSTPVYYPRYLSFTAPAMALLLGVSVVALGRSTVRVAVITSLLSIAALPNYVVVQRGPYSKEGMDFSQVADVVAAHATPGDCLALDNTAMWKPGPIRALTAAEPWAYDKLVDPGRGTRAVDRNMLWDSHLSIWSWTDRMRTCTVLWLVSDRDGSQPDHQTGDHINAGARLDAAPAYRAAAASGFQIVERWQFNFAQVVKATH
ncbi:glycosyltransferase family 39 protein [soil metagenome]